MRMAHCHRVVQTIVPILILVVVGLLPSSTDAVAAYWWYENATCVDKRTIQGISHLSFDDPSYYSWDTTENKFYGGCFYFTGGHIDLGNWDFNNGYNYGTCVTCNNVAGCSSDGTCDNFMTYPPSTSSTSAYSAASSSSSSSSKYSTTTASSSSYKLSNPASTSTSTATAATTTTTATTASYESGSSTASVMQQKALQASRQGSVNSKAYTTTTSSSQRKSSFFTRGGSSIVIVMALIAGIILIIRIRKYWRAKRPAMDLHEETTAVELPDLPEYYLNMAHGDHHQPSPFPHDTNQQQQPEQHNRQPHYPKHLTPSLHQYDAHETYYRPHDDNDDGFQTFASERILV